jgi:type II secretory pathway component PulK
MFKELKNNSHGVVFVTVLVIIIVAMVLVMSILSLNVSQVRNAETELKYIQAKALADGALARFLVSQFSPSPANAITYSELLGSTSFTVVANSSSVNSTLTVDPLAIDINF